MGGEPAALAEPVSVEETEEVDSALRATWPKEAHTPAVVGSKVALCRGRL